MRAHVNAKHSIGKDGPNSPNVAIDLESIFIDSNSAETAKVGGNQIMSLGATDHRSYQSWLTMFLRILK